MRIIFKSIFVLYLSIIVSVCSAQLVVNPSQTAAVLASTLAGPGISVLSPTLTCPALANGTFTATGTPLTMSGGIVLTNGHASACAGAEGPLVSYVLSAAGDTSVSRLLPSGTATVDACTLEFDMVAAGDTIGFNYQFGSEEYRNAVCSIYTDVFAFFISGPGITGAPNIALVPGTNIPVEINSVNNGGLGTVGGAAHINCTSLGTGSPFTSYYVDNTGGTTMTYRGYTTKFRAAHSVIACDTYHLKLTIVDAGNGQYDSGVFLEGGSLKTNSYSFLHTDSLGSTINAVAHTLVRGCSPTKTHVTLARTVTTATTLTLSFGGTAVNGVDVATLPTTITIPADSLIASLDIQALTTGTGPKELTLFLHGPCGIVDSININIIDPPGVTILTPDTSVCAGKPFTIRVYATGNFNYSWLPATDLSANNIKEPICTTFTGHTYSLTASLPGSGCPDITKNLTVSVLPPLVATATADLANCAGSIQLAAEPAGSRYSYLWSGTAAFTSTMRTPVVFNAVVGSTNNYSVTVTDNVSGCSGDATVNVIVPAIVGTHLTNVTRDVAIAYGSSVQLNAWNAYLYTWKPNDGSLSNPNINNPVARIIR